MTALKRFAADTCERAVKTVAQTAVALLGAGAINVLELDWVSLCSVSAGAGLVSVLTSIASRPIGGDPESASLVPLPVAEVEPYDPKHD